MFSMNLDSKKAVAKLDLHIQEIQDNASAAMSEVGEFLSGKMAEKISTGQLSPPLSPGTIAAKGSSDILVDTGELLGMITHKESGPMVTEVGVFNDAGAEPRATIAMHHEFGAPEANIPERSFIRSTVNETKPQVRKIFKKHTDFSKK